MASFVEDYDNSWRKARKVQWLQRAVAEQPTTAILRDATTNNWLCSGKDGSIWNDFKIPGLDAVALQYGNAGDNDMDLDDGEEEDGLPLQINLPQVPSDAQDYVPTSPAYSPYITPDEFDGKSNSGGVANMWAEVVDALQGWDPTASPGNQPRGYATVKRKYREFYNQYYGGPQGMSKHSDQEENKDDEDELPYFPPMGNNDAIPQHNIQADPNQGSAFQDPIEINISEDINPPPQTNAIMAAFSQAERDPKFREAMTRVRVGLAQQRQQATRGTHSNPLRAQPGGILESISRRMENATNFYNTSQEAALLLWGRNKPGVGEIISTTIENGQGPNELIGITPAGFTTYIVCIDDGNNLTTPTISEWGVYPTLAQELKGSAPPGTINAIQLGGENANKYIIQFPMSHERQSPGNNNPALQSRINLLFFMNPEELKNIMTEGLFHRLEYYSDAFQPTFNRRYAALKAARGGDGISFLAKCDVMMKAVLETFTTTAAFTDNAKVRLGRPDALYTYLCFKFYVNKIMELTNELTIVNTKIENSVQGSDTRALISTQQTLRTKLYNIIKEMDVWNFIMQTTPAGKLPTDVGYWNFSALGISRIPGTEQVATFTENTKPWSCYPRFMYQTFQQLEIVDGRRPGFDAAHQDMAINARVFQFTEEMPSALEMIRFKNMQSMYEYALLNRDEMLRMNAGQKLEMLRDTYANKRQTVGEAMREQQQSDDLLCVYIARAAGMSENDFLQITSQQKAAVRAQSALSELERKKRESRPAFSLNEIVALPSQQHLQSLRDSVTESSPLGTQVNILGPNPHIIITAISIPQPGRIVYSYRRVSEQGTLLQDSPVESIEEYYLLACAPNVAQANKNLIKSAIEALDNQQDNQTGLSIEDAARILGVQQFLPSDISVDIDVRYYDAKLQELDYRNLINADGTPSQAARRADGITLLMATNLRAEREAFRDQFRLLQNQAQLVALTGQHGQEYWSDSNWRQAYVYQKYELYKKKWKSLQRSWNTMARLDEVARQPNGDRPPLQEWVNYRMGRMDGGDGNPLPNPNSVLSLPVRVINTGFCISVFDKVVSSLPDKFRVVVSSLRQQVFAADQTLAETWNNGNMLSFGEWAALDAELHQRAQSVSAQAGSLLTTYDQVWYDNYTTALEEQKQQKKDDDDAFRLEQQAQQEQAQQQARQQAQQQAETARQQQRQQGRQQAEENMGAPRGDDEGKRDEEMTGGRRKKKTKTKSKYNKMGGRKKKTRKKRGGASCKKTKDCTGNKMCLPGGTQNIEGGEGQCVPKPVFVSHMKSRGQKKRDERAAAKEEEQPEVDLSSLEPSTTTEAEKTEETTTDVPVTEAEKTEETTTDVPVTEAEKTDDAAQEINELNALSLEDSKKTLKETLTKLPNIWERMEKRIQSISSQEGAGKKKRKKRRKSKRRKSKRRKSKRRKSKRKRSRKR